MSSRNFSPFDAIVIGAGAAGMMCAAVAGQQGARVLLIEHATKLAEKIRISGGGRCNFTNLQTRFDRFVSENPDFARSALARYTPADFVELIGRHGIASHEKHRGQLFCDDSSEQIIAMLKAECDRGGVKWQMPYAVRSIERADGLFVVEGDAEPLRARRLVIATGGLSIPKLGASDFGYRIARQFGLRIVEPRPALVPLTFDADEWRPFVALAGVSLEVEIRAGSARFREDLLFTHRGLSGPAVLQISTYWNPREAIEIDLVPDRDVSEIGEHMLAMKSAGRKEVGHALSTLLPRRLAELWVERHGLPASQRMAEIADDRLRDLVHSCKRWVLQPTGTEGFRKAEVTRGGVATDELAQTTLEAKSVPGLYFIGEVVDVTGWLGGYNFQWAWASAVAAARSISP